MELLIIIMRLLLIFNLAFIFGIERQRHHKPVGFGTFIFVAIGSAALSMMAEELSPDNPLPLLGAIMSGIGFLGAGALIKSPDKVAGFTTAASIWTIAILGVVIGIGEYLVGFTLYFLMCVVIFFDRHLEKKGIGSYRKKLTICTDKLIEEKDVREFLKKIGIKETHLIMLEIEKNSENRFFSYFVEGDLEKIKRMPGEVSKNKWINSFKLE